MSSFLSQLMVVPTSSSLHFHVPTNTTSNATELTSLNDITITHVSATIATTTATKTQVTATRTATTNMPKYQIDKCKATRTQHKTRSPSILHLAKKAANYATQRNLLLFFIRNDPAIMISSLLLPRDSARPSITTATNATFSLQSIDESFSTGAEQVASATIHIDSFKLIDALASEGAIFAPYVFENVFIPTNKSNHEGAWAQETSCQTSKLIVIYFKRFLYFRKDCGIFCEGEWEQQQQLDEHTNRLVGLIGFISLFDFIGVVGLLGLDRLVGIVAMALSATSALSVKSALSVSSISASSASSATLLASALSATLASALTASASSASASSASMALLVLALSASSASSASLTSALLASLVSRLH